jgi:hypothetical protein
MDFLTDDNLLEDFDMREEREESIQSQYSASPHMLLVIYAAMRKYIDPSFDIDLFHKKIFDLVTAEGRGLDNWGEILGITRYLDLSAGEYFGFEESNLYPFDQAPFVYPNATARHALTDAAYRKLLWYKAMANIAPSDAWTVNQLMKFLYDGRGVFLLDIQNMTVRLVFEFILEPYENAIFLNYGLLARAGGVGFEWLQADLTEDGRPDYFGFAGSEMRPFNQAPFHPWGIQTYAGGNI